MGVGHNFFVLVNGESLNGYRLLFSLAAIAGGNARTLGNHSLDHARPVLHRQGVFDNTDPYHLNPIVGFGDWRDPVVHLTARLMQVFVFQPQTDKRIACPIADDNTATRKIEFPQTFNGIYIGSDGFDILDGITDTPHRITVNQDILLVFRNQLVGKAAERLDASLNLVYLRYWPRPFDMQPGFLHRRRDFAKVGQHALLRFMDSVKTAIRNYTNQNHDNGCDDSFKSHNFFSLSVLGIRVRWLTLPQRDLFQAPLVGNDNFGIARKRGFQLLSP